MTQINSAVIDVEATALVASMSALTAMLNRLILTIEDRFPPFGNAALVPASPDPLAESDTSDAPLSAQAERAVSPTAGADSEPLAVVAHFPVAPVPANPVLPIPGQAVSSASSDRVTYTPYPVAPAALDPVLPIPGLVPAVASAVTVSTVAAAIHPLVVSTPVLPTPDPNLALPPITPHELADDLLSRPNPPDAKWYLVSAGREPGIYAVWDEVHPLVNGVSGSAARRIGSRADALAAYTRAYDAGRVYRR